jgi:coenzyme PQQ synthesis protein D (PqqD)
MVFDSSTASLVSRRARIPDYVVHRRFAQETVVLNLRTGCYHGLNPTGGRMLEVLDSSPSVADAAELLALEFEQPLAAILEDIVELCTALLERALIEVVAE